MRLMVDWLHPSLSDKAVSVHPFALRYFTASVGFMTGKLKPFSHIVKKNIYEKPLDRNMRRRVMLHRQPTRERALNERLTKFFDSWMFQLVGMPIAASLLVFAVMGELP